MWEVRREVVQRGGYAAPGPDMIMTGRVFKECTDDVSSHHLADVTNACKDLGYISPRAGRWRMR